jgi:dihydropteroate synthase
VEIDPDPPTPVLDCAGYRLDLGVPRVMGILNTTPDSFSDGGRFLSVHAALRHADAMVEAGAAIIDVGGESTRPGATEIAVDEELRRITPIVEALARRLPVPISIDTSKPEVMRAAAAAGAGMINDVHALRRPGAESVAAALGLPVCLMHMQGEPATMQADPRYWDVVAEVLAFLKARVNAVTGSGIPMKRLLVDPGFGFGKTLAHNLTLFAGLEAVAALGLPLLVGVSRKGLLGAVTGRPVGERVAAGVACAVMAADRGARLIRTHDVAETVDALRMRTAVMTADATG